MVDLHAHILPFCDDGPSDWSQSVALCEMAAQDGIRTIVATPHTLRGTFLNSGSRVKEVCAELNARLAQRNLDLTVLPGADVAIHPKMLDLVKKGEVLTVNDRGRYVMLEFPDFFLFHPVQKMIAALAREGITTIVSHPERSHMFREEPETLTELLGMGALCQVTAMSLTGGFGKVVRRFTERLLRGDLVHIIASDCHSIMDRPPILSAAVQAASNLVGPDRAKAMVTTIPRSVVNGNG